MSIGTIYKTKRDILFNKPGTYGICYENYFIGNRPGISVIFENGNYDGFSPDDQELFLQEVGCLKDFQYDFKNVMKLSNDFREGFFELFFRQARKLQ